MAVITGTSDVDELTGTADDDTIKGLAGNDTLNGMAGANRIVGGLGDDTYVVGLGQDTLIELAGQGTDTVRSSISYTLGNNLENLVLAVTLGDVLRFVDSGETIFLTRVADAGNPIVGTWHVANAGEAGGNSAVTFLADGSYMFAQDGDPIADPSGQDGMERGTYTWDAATGAFSSITITDTNGEWGLSHSNFSSVQVDGDTLTVVDSGETIVLTRVADADNPIVGAWHFADSLGEVALTFLADGSYMLAEDGDADPFGQAGMERGTYTWNAATGAFSSITITDTNGEWGLSHDSSLSSVDVFSGGTGNALNNVIVGNAAENVLRGLAGNDTLIGNGGDDTLNGGLGNDRLDGGAGDDAMVGGAGNDTFVVDSLADAVTELAAQGTDTIESFLSYTLGATFENLTLVGADSIDGTGNAVNNVITGNGAANILAGGAGNDTLNGGDGNDFIDGGAGIDMLRGGIGDDGYAMRAGDLIVEKADEGTDLVESLTTYTLPANVENLNLHGTANINATGNALNNTIIGNDGNNILDGRGGDLDTLAGGKGNDTYVYTGHQAITENADEGTDTVKASVSHNLSDGDNLENVTLTGLLAIDTDGNAANNVLTGNGAANLLAGFAANDTLKGGGGNDILIGGDGNDTLVGGAGADTFVFDTAPGSTNRDAITDFVHGQDHMQFDQATFTDVGAPGALDPGQFHSGAGLTNATDADDHFIYNTTSGALYYDADGVGGSAGIQIATLANHAAIDAFDFTVV